jgi:hypothetical protein
VSQDESERVRRARERVGDGYVDERESHGRRGYRWRGFGEDRPDDPVPDSSDYAASVSTRHGALSVRMVDPIAATLASELLADRPDLERFPEAVAAWSRAESRCLLLESWFVEHGLLDEKGRPTASERLLASSERLAMQLRAQLGLDPASEAALATAQADAARNVVDLDALRAKGREALKARRALDAGRVRGDGGRVRDDEAK